MDIVFYGGKQAGMISLLAIATTKHNVKYIVPEDEIIATTAKNLQIPTINKDLINESNTLEKFKQENIDLLVCCHGRKILNKDILSLGCINIHPCLYKYKGADPIKRLIEDKNTKASVGIHWMTEEIDVGEIITELFKEVEIDSVVDVYNQLYPLYSNSIIEALKIIENNKEKIKN